MAAIRNGCIARGSTPATGFILVYTVPTAHALLLKSVFASPAGATLPDFHVYFQSRDNAVLIEFLIIKFATSTDQRAEFWTALNEGDKILINSLTAQTNYWMAGAVLPYAGGSATLPLEAEAVAIGDLDAETRRQLQTSPAA